MTMPDCCLAVDLGAESGRVIAGTLGDGRLALEVVHRFPSKAVTVGATIRWDVHAIFAEIKAGIAAAAKRWTVRSIGVDTWGVDYALVDAGGGLVELPYCYRDKRTEGVVEQLQQRFGEQALFERTGIRTLIFNTLPQLVAHRRDDPATLAKAARIIPITDLFHLWLSGVAACDRTQVGTWQLATPGAVAWDDALIADIGIDRRCFGSITPTGTILGPVLPDLARELGLPATCRVILPGCHDTACAVAGMGADPAGACYLSSGTWSLLGAVADAPNVAPAFSAAGFSNEVAVDGRPRLNKNIMGLWVVQECRRAFVAAGREASYAELAQRAAALPPSRLPLDVDDPRFFSSSLVDAPMPERVRAWCRERGAPEPASDAELVRLCLDGLADAYRRALADLERLSGRRFAAINIVGGGSNNALLNQLTADACARPVLAGPGEATAYGNLLVQARSLGLIASADEARAVLARSVELVRVEPRAQARA
jgi:rhamnulokinase